MRINFFCLMMAVIYFCVVPKLYSADFSGILHQEAQKMADAMTQDDFETVATYTLPLVVNMTGGKDKMIEIMKTGSIQMKQEGFSFDSVIIGTPAQAIDINGKLYALVPENVKMKAPGGILQGESYLMAISEDHGNSWYFMDTAGLTDEQRLKKILPDIVGKIEIPKPQKSIFIPNR